MVVQRTRLAAAVVVAALVAVIAAGCGGTDDGGGGGGSGASSASSGQRAADEEREGHRPELDDGAKGRVTYCTGKDTTGETKEWSKRFNAKYKAQGLSVQILEFPASADAQRQQFVQRQEAKAGDCDVFRSDVIWTAEFASQSWLYDLSPYVDRIKDRLLASSLETATYDGQDLGRAVLHERGAPLLPQGQGRPGRRRRGRTLYQQAASNGGIVFQGAAYEGLTCDWLELAFAAGGSVLSDGRPKATIDSPQNVAATKLMADAVKERRRAEGRLDLHGAGVARRRGRPASPRSCATGPTPTASARTRTKLKGKFAVAPLPAYEGAGKASILGGGNSVISRFSKNPGGALAVVDFLASQDWQTTLTAEFSQMSPFKATYDQPSVKKAIPFATEIRQAIEQARARPVSPVYPQISQAIYRNVNDALAGRTSPAEAMKRAQADIEQALATF